MLNWLRITSQLNPQEIVNHLYNMETMCLLTACLAASMQDTGGGGGGGSGGSSPLPHDL